MQWSCLADKNYCLFVSLLWLLDKRGLWFMEQFTRVNTSSNLRLGLQFLTLPTFRMIHRSFRGPEIS